MSMQAVRLVNTLGMAEEEWKLHRLKGIGGSDIAAIAGVNPYRSRFQVWLDKTGRQIEEPENDAMHFGHKLEPVVADEFAERHPDLKIQRVNAILQHPSQPIFLANIDRLVKDKANGDAILEIKTTSFWSHKQWEDGKIPDAAACQVQWYMGITGLSKAYVAALIGGNRYAEYEVLRDDELIGHLQKIALEFWSLVETETPPDPEGSESDTEALSILYKLADKGSVIELPGNAQALINEYNEAKSQEDTWAERKAEASNKLKAVLKTKEIGVFGDSRVRWFNIEQDRLDTKTLKAELPEIYKKYANKSVSRRFEVKGC